MSIRAVVWALDQKCPSPISKLVLITLASYASHDGECFPSQARIASDCSVGRPHVCAQIKLLEKLGFLENKTRINEKGQQTSLYFLRCQPADRPPVSIGDTPCQPADTEPVIEPKKERTSSLRSDGADAPPTPPDPVKDLWDRGKAILGEQGASLIGQMVSKHGRPAVLGAIVACEAEPPVGNVAAYFIRCCEQRRRDAPQNYHHAKLGPVSTIYAGAMNAADKFEQKQRDRGLDRSAPLPLLGR